MSGWLLNNPQSPCKVPYGKLWVVSYLLNSHLESAPWERPAQVLPCPLLPLEGRQRLGELKLGQNRKRQEEPQSLLSRECPPITPSWPQPCHRLMCQQCVWFCCSPSPPIIKCLCAEEPLWIMDCCKAWRYSTLFALSCYFPKNWSPLPLASLSIVRTAFSPRTSLVPSMG